MHYSLLLDLDRLHPPIPSRNRFKAIPLALPAKRHSQCAGRTPDNTEDREEWAPWCPINDAGFRDIANMRGHLDVDLEPHALLPVDGHTPPISEAVDEVEPEMRSLGLLIAELVFEVVAAVRGDDADRSRVAFEA
jgi:hypothetical protein